MIIILGFNFISVFAQVDAAIGEWRFHLPYNQVTTIAQIDSKIYCGTENAYIFYLDYEDNDLRTFSKVDDFAEIGVSQMEYNPEFKTLVIAYSNANIDLLVNETTIINVPDIKNELIVGDKNIYDIHFVNEKAYLSTGFGIVVLDIVQGLILDTYFIGENSSSLKVNEISDDGTTIMTATEDGVYYADLNDPFLFNSANWNKFDESDGILSEETGGIVFFNQKFHAFVQNTLYAYDGSVWSPLYSLPSDWFFGAMDINDSQVVFSEFKTNESGGIIETRLALFTPITETVYIQSPQNIRRPQKAITDENGTLWVAEKWGGLAKITNNEYQTTYKINAPNTIRVLDMAVKNGEVWVAPTPENIEISWSPIGSKDGFFKYNTLDSWENFNQYNFPIISENTMWDIMRVKAHPTENTIYFGSYYGGLLELKDDVRTVFNGENSSLQAPTADPSTIRVTGLDFDSSNNLWMTNYAAPNPISVKKNDGEWLSFGAGFSFSENVFIDILVDDYNNKWCSVRNQGLVVFNEGDDMIATSDDFYRQINTLETKGNLPSNNVFSMLNDKEGEIWIGTGNGIVIFYCAFDIFNTSCTSDQPIIDVNGKLGRLFNGERVRAMVADGANRKWIGTETGLFLISEDGRKQIANFNTTNSFLPSNVVVSLAIDDATGELFIGTDKGIVSYKTDATGGGLVHENVMVYPNPVRPEYEGPIAIKGLVENANVKITDVSGQLIYETTALGGQAVWDGKNYNGKRAHTGVYLVFSSNTDGTESFVTKLFFVN